jgi:U3 small nucleolar RNA-associated protein 12
MILPLAVLPISSKHRVSQIAYHPTEPFLAIQSQDRAVDIFRIRTEEELRKKQTRRQKRAKEKKKVDTDVTETNHMEQAEDAEFQLVDLYTPYLIIRASGKIRSFTFVASGNHQKGVQVRGERPYLYS